MHHTLRTIISEQQNALAIGESQQSKRVCVSKKSTLLTINESEQKKLAMQLIPKSLAGKASQNTSPFTTEVVRRLTNS